VTSIAIQSTPTTTTVKPANWWDKFGEPKYGGEIVIPYAGLANITFDNYSLIGSDYQFWLESLYSKMVWTLDRNEFAYLTDFVPEKYITGSLAESWERPDPQSLVIHLHQGIRWQNKAPVNGREFTAYDVQSHYDRILGTGGGYSTPAPTYMGSRPNWDKVVALDKYTVKLTFTKPTGSIGVLTIMETMSMNTIEAPEWVALGGPPAPATSSAAPGPPPAGGPPAAQPTGVESPLTDWHNAVGTGPWMLTDYVMGSAMTYSKNPNYWGYDERYPKNKIPYADTLKMLIIQDATTKLAAIRTAKIDTLSMVTKEQYEPLAASNPDMQYIKQLGGAEGVTMRVDREPFTDIRVRTALQMSVDLSAVAKKLSTDATPIGFMSPLLKGCYYPYAEWPQSLKDEFAYNPTGAKQLLADAGYPDGFKTDVVIGSNASTDILQILKAYFLDVGVDMEIRVMDVTAARAFTAAGKQDAMTAGGGGFAQGPTSALSRFDINNKSVNTCYVNDPTYQAIVEELNTAADSDAIAAVMKKADKRIIEQHWLVITVPSISYTVWQPYLKGFSGEVQVRWAQGGWMFARLWVTK